MHPLLLYVCWRHSSHSWVDISEFEVQLLTFPLWCQARDKLSFWSSFSLSHWVFTTLFIFTILVLWASPTKTGRYTSLNIKTSGKPTHDNWAAQSVWGVFVWFCGWQRTGGQWHIGRFVTGKLFWGCVKGIHIFWLCLSESCKCPILFL